MDVAVCIPVRDSEAAAAITKNTVTWVLAARTDLALVVVDNASPCRDAVAFIRDLAGADRRLVLIENETNRGVGPAYNQGLAWGYQHGAAHFVCMNNDIEVDAAAAATWLPMLLQPLRAQPRQLVGVRLIPRNEMVDREGQTHPYLEGYCLAFARPFLDEVGYFDERFAPAWVEDVEICWRATRHGYALTEVAVPLRHIGSQSHTGMPRDLITLRNVWRLVDKARAGSDGRMGWPQG